MLRRFSWLILSLVLLFSFTNLTMAAGVLGVTDLMYTPTTTTLAPGQVGAAINFAEDNLNYFNLDLGLVKDFELGVAAFHYPDNTDVSVRAKFRLLEEKRDTPGLAIGIQDVGTDDVSPYLVLSKHFSDAGIDGYIGAGGGWYDGIFGGINKAFYPSKGSGLNRIDLYVEGDSHRLNIGTKLALGSQIKLNLGLVDMDRWMMGATFLFK